MSVPRITEAARVGVGSIYRLTPSKSSLAALVFDHVIDDLSEALSKQAEFHDGMSPRDFFWANWTQFAGWARSSPECFRFAILHVFTGAGRGHVRLQDIRPLRRIFEFAGGKGWLLAGDYNVTMNVILGPLALLVLSAAHEERLCEDALRLTGEAIERAFARGLASATPL